MMNRTALLGWILAAALGSACGAGGDEPSTPESLGTTELSVAAVELNEASGSCDLGNYVTIGWDGGEYGKGSYNKATDNFCIWDEKEDSMRVGVHWKLGDGSRQGICYFTGGNGNSGRCNKELPEGKHLDMRIGRCNGSVYPCNAPSGAGWQWDPWGNGTST
ncbi:hypothetical protein [Corallococcus caeni]|uniref:hypothetical protein n=1 Tax=Corallococcus caeni TaxID=3082388 RepID=UPI0030C739C4